MFTWPLTYQQSVFKQYHKTKISQRFTYKMAEENGGHRYGIKLRHCHAVYTLLFTTRHRFSRRPFAASRIVRLM